jgi:hypothetical protein
MTSIQLKMPDFWPLSHLPEWIAIVVNLFDFSNSENDVHRRQNILLGVFVKKYSTRFKSKSKYTTRFVIEHNNLVETYR